MVVGFEAALLLVFLDACVRCVCVAHLCLTVEEQTVKHHAFQDVRADALQLLNEASRREWQTEGEGSAAEVGSLGAVMPIKHHNHRNQQYAFWSILQETPVHTAHATK